LGVLLRFRKQILMDASLERDHVVVVHAILDSDGKTAVAAG
jgi:hypothetical protein